MLKLYDYKCSKGHVVEEFVRGDPVERKCSICGLPSNRLISPIRSVFEPFSGDYHDATAKWAKHREITIKQERKEAEANA